MWKAILAVVLSIIYLISPYDIIPDMAIVWGWIDDLLIIWFAWRFYKRLKNRTETQRAKFADERYHRSSGKGFEKQNAPRPPHDEMETKSPYEVLGVSPQATIVEIKQAYRRLANLYHPDKVNHLGKEFQTLAEKKFKEIQAAYQQLRQ